MMFQNLWNIAKSSSKRGVKNDTGLPQETRKISNKPNFLPRGINKRRTKKAQSQQKEGNNNYQSRTK